MYTGEEQNKVDQCKHTDRNQVCIFEHVGGCGSIKINIWSEIVIMYARSNNTIRANTFERGIEVDFMGVCFDIYQAANAIQAVTNLYVHKKINKQMQKLEILTKSGCEVLNFGLADGNGIPPICWSRQTNKEEHADWICMSIIVAHQLNSALLKAMSWYSPRSNWDGERHSVPGRQM